MVEVEVKVKVKDKIEVVVVDEVEIITTIISTTMRKEKAQYEVVEETIQIQGTTSLKSDAIIVKSLIIMLLHVEPTITK